MSIYAVCKTPNCQQTYLVSEIVESVPEGTAVFCDICNGEVVSKTGHARLSGNPHVIAVVGSLLLNALYKEGQLYSMKLKHSEGILTWNQDESNKKFFTGVADVLKGRKKIELTQNSIDDKIIEDNSIDFFLKKNGIGVGRYNKLHLIKEDKKHDKS